jgi:hypothetical protein
MTVDDFISGLRRRALADQLNVSEIAIPGTHEDRLPSAIHLGDGATAT